MSEQKPTLSIQETMDLAVQHHTAGRLSEAEHIYEQILQHNPNQPNALHLLGVIAYQMDKSDIALDLIAKALVIQPDLAEAHNSLGLVLHALGKLDDAVASFWQALKLNPDYAEAHCNLGISLQDLGKLDEAISSYQKALTLKPNYAGAHYNQGNALRELSKLDDAVASYRQALNLKYDFADAHNNLGLTLQELGKRSEAIACYRTTMKIDHDYAMAHYNLHSLLLDPDDLAPSIKCMEKAVEIDRFNTNYRFMLGMLLEYSGNPHEAKRHFDMVENGANLYRARLDAWRYIKSVNCNTPTVVGTNIEALEIATNAAVVDGLVLEFGVRSGTSIRQIAALLKQDIHGFDSFQGLPESWHDQPRGSYSTKGVIPPVPEHVTLHEGWFEETLPGFVKKHPEPVRFMNIDCDIYSSTKTVLELLAKQIVHGTVIVFDEYIGNEHWREDEFKAFQEAVLQYGWEYEYLCFSFMTKQVVVRIN